MSRRAPLFGVVVISQSAGLLFLCAALPILGGHLARESLWLGAVAGVAGAFGILLLYAGLAAGRMGIVSPITAGIGAGFPVIWGLVRGEHLSAHAAIGLGITFVAIILCSVSFGERDAANCETRIGLPAGVAEALGSGLCLGVFFIALGSIGAGGGLTPLAVARSTSVAALVIAAFAAGRTIAIPSRYALRVIACGALDMLANVFFVLAMGSGMLAIVAILCSLYPAATVVLAALINSERLTRPQWTGVVFALTGIALIAA
ncbi:MAG: EamA family transporter [Vulcanimicrobiaceae bacterium]